MLTINGRTYNILTLDFETYYASDFTLSGKELNTSEYVRDPRFKVHGGSIMGQQTVQWLSHDQLVEFFKTVDWPNTALLGHHTAFDGFILSQRYGYVAGFYLDTMSMSRVAFGHSVLHNLNDVAKRLGLSGKVKKASLTDTKGKVDLTEEEFFNLGEYAKDDATDTRRAFELMKPYVPDSELRLIDVTIRMFADPVLGIDEKLVQEVLDEEVASKLALVTTAGVSADDLMSNDKFADLLRANNVVPPTKISVRTGKPAYAFAKTDLAFQDLENHPDPTVRNLVAARLAVKSTINETRAIRFLRAGENGAKLPVYLNYSGAHTHRWSGGNKMNLQNLMRGGKLRRSILAPPGHVIVVSDSAQIEARVLAWLAGQEDLVQAFREKRDVYSEFASIAFGRPIDRKRTEIGPDGQKFKPDELEGYIGKTCVLGLGFGMGAVKLKMGLEEGRGGPPVFLTLAETTNLVNTYRSVNNKIPALWRKMENIIQCMVLGTAGEYGPLKYDLGHIVLPNGVALHYPGICCVDNGGSGSYMYLGLKNATKIYGGLLTENVVQALARCIIAEQMLRVQDAGYRIVTSTHDEIVIVAPEADADQALNVMIEIMSTPPDWAPDLPLAAEGGYDTCYSK